MIRPMAVPAGLLALSLMCTACTSSADPSTSAAATPGTASPSAEPSSAGPSSAAPSAAESSAPPGASSDAPKPLSAKQARRGRAYTYQGVTVSGPPDEAPKVELADDIAPVDDLAVADVWRGDGPRAEAGDTVTVNYVVVGQQTRAEFDSTWDVGQPLTFGLDEVIQGIGEGLVGMRPGGRRLLLIPGSMAYGDAGSPPDIQPNETLVFVVDLVPRDQG